MLNTRLTLGALGLLALTPLHAISPAEADLPEARTLIERHIEASGGREAMLAQYELIIDAEFSMPAMGIVGQMTVVGRPPADHVTIIELPGLGEMRTGFSPELAWSVDPFMGPRLIEGEEFDILQESIVTAAVLREPEYVASATTVGRAEFNGQPCFRVQIDWHSGRQSHDCYAMESGLLIAMEMVQSSPMGEMETLIILDGFREFEGVLAPTVMRQTIMGQEQVMTVKEMRRESPDPALFELPPPIRTLVGQ